MSIVPTAADVTSAWRSLSRAPWYTATVIGVIALSVTLTATILAITDSALFKPLPYPDEASVFAIAPGHAALPSPWLRTVSPLDVTIWRQAAPDVPITAMNIGDVVTVGQGASVRAARIDDRFFEVLGRQPAVGGFEPSDYAPLEPVRPAILTHGLWLRAFGGDRSVVGRTVTNREGRGIRVVGILPAGLILPDPFRAEVLTPLYNPDPRHAGRSRRVFVRLLAGETATSLTSRLSAAAARLAAETPPAPLRPNQSERSRILSGPYDMVDLVPIRADMNGSRARTAWIILAVGGGLFLLAGLNLTALGVARARDRRRDFVLRVSLGASRTDVLRLLLVEHTLTILAGTALGLWLAIVTLRTTPGLMPAYLLMADATISLRVVLAVVALATVCAVGVGALAARSAGRGDARPDLGDGGTSTMRARPFLIGAQIATAFVLLVGGALVTGSLLRVWAEDPGVAMTDRVVFSFSTPRDMTAASRLGLIDAVRAAPGVRAAGSTDRPFVQNAFNGSSFQVPEGATGTDAESMAITEGFLEAVGVTLLAGRLPDDAELSRGDHVVVVSRQVADNFWPGSSPVGQTLLHGDGRAFTVVGLVEDARLIALDRESEGQIFWPMSSRTDGPLLHNTVVWLDRANDEGMSRVGAAVTARCSECTVNRAERLVDAFAGTIRARRFNAWLFASFSGAALVIAAVGVLGVVAMSVARRTREMGIRLALGSTRGRLVRTVLGEQVRPIVLGLIAGAAGATWTARLAETFLDETTVYDPLIWSAAVATLLGVALLATFVPSWRVSKTDPVRALRVD
ncbi:MAG TPA: FtsX-like permease family protein [Vicinamibacterales bacterium]|nr:FtsX-like permease family protein [Vicinamibacterales bacterium]